MRCLLSVSAPCSSHNRVSLLSDKAAAGGTTLTVPAASTYYQWDPSTLTALAGMRST